MHKSSNQNKVIGDWHECRAHRELRLDFRCGSRGDDGKKVLLFLLFLNSGLALTSFHKSLDYAALHVLCITDANMIASCVYVPL